MGAGLLSTGTAGAAILDFEGVFTAPTQGFISGNEFAGVTIAISGAGAGQLGLYNSACRDNCTGGDLDLATGAGITAAPISAGEDSPAEDYLLISGAVTNNGFGDQVGSPLFTFSFDVPNVVTRVVLIDIDENPDNVSMIFEFADGSPSASFDGTNASMVLNPGENNSWGMYDIAAISALLGIDFLRPVSAFKIQYSSISGGIASITSTPVPTPTALPLLAGGLALMGWMARHRRTNASA